MKKQGLAYECATNGLEALNIYKASPLRFYLILMDMSMPVSVLGHLCKAEKATNLIIGHGRFRVDSKDP